MDLLQWIQWTKAMYPTIRELSSQRLDCIQLSLLPFQSDYTADQGELRVVHQVQKEVNGFTVATILSYVLLLGEEADRFTDCTVNSFYGTECD